MDYDEAVVLALRTIMEHCKHYRFCPDCFLMNFCDNHLLDFAEEWSDDIEKLQSM